MPQDQKSVSRNRYLKVLPAVGATALLMILAVMLVLSLETRTRFGDMKAGWDEYSQAADPRGIWISEIRGYFGYGGLIHNFKNYVLRHDHHYAEELTGQTERLLAVIDAYLASGPDAIEVDALGRVRAVVEEYSQNIELITAGIEQDKSAEEIDADVRVDDTDALAALQTLESHWSFQRRQNLAQIVSAVTEGENLVRSLAGVMAVLTVLVGIIGVLFYVLVVNALRSNAAQIREFEARKVAQLAERRLAWAVQQSPTSILITGTDGKIEFANNKLLELTGYTADEIVGKSPNIFKSGHTPAVIYRDIWKRLAKGEPWHGVFKNLRKDGSHYWAETSILPLLDDEGHITNYIGIGEDLTEKRHVDQQIAQVQKMEAVGILAGSVAHDFNNVLMTIIGNTELIRLEAEDLESAGDIETSVNHIELASRRARALIQQLLTFARQQPGQSQRLNLNDAINEALELIRVSTPPTISIDYRTDVTDVATDMDPTAFFQIVMNLCHNAVEAIADSGGTISLRLSALDPGDAAGLAKLPEGARGTVQLEVSDNGPGIPGALHGKVFEPFFSTKPVGKGTGLGLAIVRNWVEEVGGAVRLDETVQKGTCFHLLFPMFDAVDSAAQNEEKAQTGDEHILLVDDEENLLYAVRRMLARLGYRVEAYSDPSRALNAFRAAPDSYDGLVTDLMMPGMTGTELILAVRRTRQDLPAMLFSSYFDEAHVSDQLEPVTKLSKPVDLAGLARAVRDTLDGA